VTAGFTPLTAGACRNRHRLIETMSQRTPDRALRRRDRVVSLLVFEEFPHIERITCFLKGLLGQKSAAYKPQGCSGRRSRSGDPTRPSVAILLSTSDHKTLLYQVQTMEIRTPLD
jgi:hypothetical protein